jgi:hypothetical protein
MSIISNIIGFVLMAIGILGFYLNGWSIIYLISLLSGIGVMELGDKK